MHKHLFLIILLFPFLAFSQKEDDKKQAEFGIHLRPIFESAAFGTAPINVEGDELSFVINQTSGFSYGAIIRYEIIKNINFEGGLSVTTRNIRLDISDSEFDYNLQTNFKFLTYEFPINLMTKVRFTDQWKLAAAFGATMDFLPSDVESFGEDNSYDHRTFYRSWIQAALTAHTGVEWESKESGAFYLGVSYHRPFQDLAITRVETNKWNPQLNRNESNELVGSINGTYLTVDFRYFFNDKKR